MCPIGSMDAPLLFFGGYMSFRIAQQVKRAAEQKLRAHYSDDPQMELSEERVEQLEEEIARAEMHMEDCEEDA